LTPEEFDPRDFVPGRRHSCSLVVRPGSPELDLPVLLVRGRNAGKTLVVFAGVHGDEYEGVRSILDLYEELDPATMSGDLLAVPVANPPAFWAASRINPLDERNLARVFPGDSAAAPTDAIAHVLGSALIARADFFLDLHSAGVKLLMPTMVGYDSKDASAREAAMIFGAPVLWAHSYIPPGRTISFTVFPGFTRRRAARGALIQTTCACSNKASETS